MATVTLEQGRECVLREVRACASTPGTETIPLLQSAGRVLARDVSADRDYPPVARSVRDGFALRSGDEPRNLRVIGEVRAGESFDGQVGEGQAVEIMTGAPIPSGADAVVMVEHVTRDGDRISTEKRVRPGEAINPRGSEALRGDIVVPCGRRLTYTDIAVLATVGHSNVTVYRKPRVAILATGDEVVELDRTPRPFEVRNSNAQSLAIQVERAGGAPEILPVARDNHESTSMLVERGLAYDLLLLSGGVSAGKYDIVEGVLSEFGAVFYFDRALIQPGQPLVFGKARGTFFFGLPGNPASTMVTFEIFARAALDLLSGVTNSAMPIAWARLAEPFRQRPGLTRFLPATLSENGELTPMHWAGSSDVVSMAKANAYLVSDPERESWEAGDLIRVMMK